MTFEVQNAGAAVVNIRRGRAGRVESRRVQSRLAYRQETSVKTQNAELIPHHCTPTSVFGRSASPCLLLSTPRLHSANSGLSRPYAVSHGQAHRHVSPSRIVHFDSRLKTEATRNVTSVGRIGLTVVSPSVISHRKNGGCHSHSQWRKASLRGRFHHSQRMADRPVNGHSKPSSLRIPFLTDLRRSICARRRRSEQR